MRSKALKPHFLGRAFDARMLSGVYKIVILHHMKGKGMYPYRLYKQFSSHVRPGMPKLSKSDLYNLVTSLEKEGFIRGKAERSGAVVHKYYTTTKKGAVLVKNSKKIVAEAFGKMQQLIRDELNG